VAAGLAAAHAQGLVHRDIKPANILLEDGVERLRITDFGLARAADDASLTRSGVIAGTPQFMSPEQARGEAIDPRSDLFSLGSVLYTACTGRAPFRAETSYGVLRRITDDTPRPIRELNPEIPDWLAATIDKLHAKDPAQRHQSADEVAELFEQCLAHVQQPTMSALPNALRLPKPPPNVSRHRRPWWIGGAVAAGILIVAGVTMLQQRPSDGDRQGGQASDLANAAAIRERAAMARSSAASRWEDGAAEQISEVETEIEDIEKTAYDKWDQQFNRDP
jgi:serine/threonine protein kinase